MKRKTKKLVKRIGTFAAVAALVLIVITSYYLGQRSTEDPRWAKPDAAVAGGGIKVELYYYNKLKDGEQTFDPKFVLPVARAIPRAKTPIKGTIRLLLKGKLTWQEKASGFTTEFPHHEFKLKSARLKNGLLTLEFTEVPGFTSGGAGRIGLLAAQIKKTAKQFPQVKVVRFKPEYLFQP